MRAVVQRVRSASVTVVEGDRSDLTGQIDTGLVVYLGAEQGDGPSDVAWMVDKVAGLRIFADDTGKMSASVRDVGGSVLVVSQFTLFADVSRGRRPAFTQAAPPDVAESLYGAFCTALRATGLCVETGRFRTHMHVAAVVEGPVTIPLDSRQRRTQAGGDAA